MLSPAHLLLRTHGLGQRQRYMRRRAIQTRDIRLRLFTGCQPSFQLGIIQLAQQRPHAWSRRDPPRHQISPHDQRRRQNRFGAERLKRLFQKEPRRGLLGACWGRSLTLDISFFQFQHPQYVRRRPTQDPLVFSRTAILPVVPWSPCHGNTTLPHRENAPQLSNV